VRLVVSVPAVQFQYHQLSVYFQRAMGVGRGGKEGRTMKVGQQAAVWVVLKHHHNVSRVLWKGDFGCVLALNKDQYVWKGLYVIGGSLGEAYNRCRH